eukprot:gnl/MRDRNA2_/MRDRNA2_232515_c0_seq1.p1 gnl/MRDRNA2_/MRDRNA2_232515_c0~~gnl/MRDRNA2_/MRDRNA2_232515_c0_seq1.p1  ORF type:complete len:176 (+),score=26.38 gnl/MRDRNA2_/MRDRNA2_232515_c0_seq1:34-528(+)
MEGHALVMGLQLLGRDQKNHCKRMAVLVDAKTVRAAGQKGRSSAGTLKHPMRRLAAISLACNWLVRLAYLPSESNPADWPSRGKHRRQELARNKNTVLRGNVYKKYKPSKLELFLRKQQRIREKLTSCGHWLGDFSSHLLEDSADLSGSSKSSNSSNALFQFGF